jgi:hypothetical protein
MYLALYFARAIWKALAMYGETGGNRDPVVSLIIIHLQLSLASRTGRRKPQTCSLGMADYAFG